MPFTKLPTATRATLALLLLLLLAPTTAEYYSTSDENNFLRLQSHLSPSVEDVLENLSQYSKLYVSAVKNSEVRGNCVWSECGLDDQTDE